MNLRKIELLGGPFDGKWLFVPDCMDTYLCSLTPLVVHAYYRDQVQCGLGFRTVFRHAEIISAQGAY